MVPSPSWPLLLSPQQKALPFESMAQECNQPSEMAGMAACTIVTGEIADANPDARINQ